MSAPTASGPAADMETATTTKIAATETTTSTKDSSYYFKLQITFPVYAVAFTAQRTLLITGGGGISRSGVRNQLSMYSIDTVNKQIILLQDLPLSNEEDAPMTLAVNPKLQQVAAGINSVAAKLEQGQNQNLRLFSYTDTSIKYERAKQTMTSTDKDHYQRVTAFNRTTPQLVAVGCTSSQVSVLTFPALQEVFPSLDYGGEEIYDVDFDDSGEMIMGTSERQLIIWSTSLDADERMKEPIQVIERPVLRPQVNCTFRAARFGRLTTSRNIYTVVNSKAAKGSKQQRGATTTRSFISLWSCDTWSLVRTRKVSERQITAMDVSPDGTLLACGTADLSIVILDSTTLQPLMNIREAHQFAPTCIRFSPSSDLVVSSSVDYSINVIDLAAARKKQGGSSTMWTILFTLIVLLISVLVKQRSGLELNMVAQELLSL